MNGTDYNQLATHLAALACNGFHSSRRAVGELAEPGLYAYVANRPNESRIELQQALQVHLQADILATGDYFPQGRANASSTLVILFRSEQGEAVEEFRVRVIGSRPSHSAAFGTICHPLTDRTDHQHQHNSPSGTSGRGFLQHQHRSKPMTKIPVSVFKRERKPFYQCEWRDPITNKLKTKSTGTNIKRDAERFAGQLQNELEAGTYRDFTKITWQECRERYEKEVLPGRAKKTQDKVTTLFNHVERIVNPGKLTALDAAQIARLSTQLREEELTEASVKSVLATLKAFLRWAHRQGLLAAVPVIEMPKRTAGMKGRPLTLEEFERMTAAIHKGLFDMPKPKAKPKPEAAKPKKRKPATPKPPRELTPEEQARRQQIVQSWEFLLTGLWYSGLRLGEALALSWDDDRQIMVDLTGKFPMFRIQADAQKSNKAQLLPMTPDFYQFLLTVPATDRTGRVFNPVPASELRRRKRMREDNASHTIRDIGKAAGVKVSEYKNGKVKFASAHDLRRSFGFRWSQKVMPNVLQQLMRHEDITTAMTFYVGRNADSAASAVWGAAGGGTTGCSLPSEKTAGRMD